MSDCTIRISIDEPEKMARVVANLYKEGVTCHVRDNGYEYVIVLTGY